MKRNLQSFHPSLWISGVAFLLCGLLPAAAGGQGTLFVEGNNVGIGTDTPGHSLHVFGTTTLSRIVVENNPAVAESRPLFKLQNNGRVRFSFQNDDAGTTWTFDNDGDFGITKVGTGAFQLLLDGSGNMTITGALTQGSDREAKEDVVPVRGREVLTRVLGLPIAEWRYKDDEGSARHMGPMAQDFHQLFGLGSNPKGLSTLDTTGVALAAIQGLHELVQEKDEVITGLETRLARLESLVQSPSCDH